ncbi:MAG: MFS transporter permease [Acidithiobacillales bacterium SG8_45]|jgi:predicted MFS family arabinose efflux permease|nr:MAG: MFS transporter permease [Acidithiobacillales bacterium SG8_45]
MSATSIRHYSVVTASYWGFTLTDGALRMLVLLHFHNLGYSPFQIAYLFLLYESFGVVTNLLGGWLGSHLGLRITLLSGLLLQVVALVMLAQLDHGWSTATALIYVMAAQALSGVAKDLTKMSSKSAIKLVVASGEQSVLFRWVALLTGSKNALKGVGFFIGGVLLAWLGFVGSLYVMATGLVVILLLSTLMLPKEMGRAQKAVPFRHILSKDRQINLLSAARFFLFGSRDIWFVVGLPLFLSATLGWSHPQVGAYLALWVIGYGMIQAIAPRVLRRGKSPGSDTALRWVVVLIAVPLLMALAMQGALPVQYVVLIGLAIYGVVFAINSAVHSYLIVAFVDRDKVAMDVGFYYMANAAGRLAGTLLSGISYQYYGLEGCLWGSVLFLIAATAFSRRLAVVNLKR